MHKGKSYDIFFATGECSGTVQIVMCSFMYKCFLSFYELESFSS